MKRSLKIQLLNLILIHFCACQSWGKFWELPISAVSPAPGATQVKLNTPITLTFPAAVDSATLSAGSSTACSGSFQLSADNFATCLTMLSATPTAATGNTVFTFRPIPLLTANTSYTLRITEAVKFSDGGGSQEYTATFTTADVGKFLFINDFTTDDVRTYTIDRQTGFLTLNGTHALGNQCYGIGVDATGRYLLYSAHALGQVDMAMVNATNGTLTDNTPPATTLTNAADIVFHPNNQFVYILNDTAGSINKFSFSQTNGLITFQNNVAASGTATALTVNRKGTALYVLKSAANTLYSFAIDSVGNLQTTGNLTVGTNPVGLAINYDDSFIYVVNAGANITQFQLNGDGTLGANRGSVATCGDNNATIDPSGRFFYAACTASNGVDQFSINANDGSLTPHGLATIAGANDCAGVVAEPSGRFVYCTNGTTNNISTFKVDQTTGQLAQNGALVATGNQPGTPVVY